MHIDEVVETQKEGESGALGGVKREKKLDEVDCMKRAMWLLLLF